MKRRHLLKRLADFGALNFLGTPIQRLFAAVVSENIYQHEVESSAESRNYLQVNMYGAPTRFGFDNLLRPFDENIFLPNKFIGNKILAQDSKNLADIKLGYATEKIKGLNLPYQWLQQVPTANGKNRPMTDLLDNMLMIRGCKLDFSGHPLNAMQQICPIQDGLSLNGVVGDVSPALFSAVSVGNNPVTRAFKSESCLLTEVPYFEKNYLEYLLNPFVIKKTDRMYTNTELEEQFNHIVSSYPKRLKDIGVLKQNSIKNLKDNIDLFLTQYSALVLKYKKLINTSIATSDCLPSVPTPRFPYQLTSKQKVTDVLGPFVFGRIFCIADDAVNLVKTGQLNYWAEQFALSEFLLTHNLCKSILISPPSPDIGDTIENIHVKEFVRMDDLDVFEDSTNKNYYIDVKKTPGARINKQDKFDPIPMDSHVHGVVYELIATTLFFRGITACTLELIDVLKNTKHKNGTLFDETIIHLASEFDRFPQLDGAGTHHNANSNPTSLLSGCIKGPQIIGNIFIGDRSETSPCGGTVGNGAPVKELGSAIKISHVSSSLSTLLRVKPIVPRSPSILKEENGQVISLIEKPKNLEGIE